MRWRLSNDEMHARRTLIASGLMALTSVALILATLLVWYPRTVS
jgi:hypothetical protein